MTVATVSALRDLESRARNCWDMGSAILRYSIRPDEAPEGLDLDRVISTYQARLAEESAAFPGKDELLWFVATAGTEEPEDWPFFPLTIATAHGWALKLGFTLSLWDRRFAELDHRYLSADLPGTPRDVQVIVRLDEDFFERLAGAGEAIRREHRRAARFLLDRGGSITLTPTPEPSPTVLANPNDERDGWLHRERLKGRTLGEIKADLNREWKTRGWENIEAEQSIRAAIDRFCRRHKLPLVRRNAAQ